MGQQGHGDVVEEPLAEGLGTGAASMAVKHPEEHAPRLQQGGRAAPVLDGRVSRQLIAVEAHHRTQVFAVKLGHLKTELVGFQDAVDLRRECTCKL